MPSTENNTPAAAPRTLRRWLQSDMRTLRWVLLTLYLLIILGLLLFAALENDATPMLILLGSGGAAQALFILGGGTIELCRPIRRRRLLMPVIVAALMLSVLLGGLVIATVELLRMPDAGDEFLFVLMYVLGASWIGWGVLLFAHVKHMPRFQALSRLSQYLLAGSLAELLATVPSHIIVSRRPGCLVGMFTMLGIIAGLSVMLFSFGPMIVLLFLRPRLRAERRDGVPYCPSCGYDLRASKERCPECGLAVS